MSTLKIRTQPGGPWTEVGGYVLSDKDKQEIASMVTAKEPLTLPKVTDLGDWDTLVNYGCAVPDGEFNRMPEVGDKFFCTFITQDSAMKNYNNVGWFEVDSITDIEGTGGAMKNIHFLLIDSFQVISDVENYEEVEF